MAGRPSTGTTAGAGTAGVGRPSRDDAADGVAATTNGGLAVARRSAAPPFTAGTRGGRSVTRPDRDSRAGRTPDPAGFASDDATWEPPSPLSATATAQRGDTAKVNPMASTGAPIRASLANISPRFS